MFDYISVTLDGYNNDVTDKIVAFPTTYAWKMANYGKLLRNLFITPSCANERVKASISAYNARYRQGWLTEIGRAHV